ncbi:hypothetical protein ACFWAY_46185 [Rhodococcus sp. NPDC059968]|uniref:hypothetical protein n=1 Tax=Rhodococcus sp. NPDC059968 TaxID=3347017 RepID=UPI00367262C2
MTRWWFDGEITGLGTGSGVRIVVGHWSRSPLGEFADAMVELADGHRVLLAPSDAVRDFVTASSQSGGTRTVEAGGFGSTPQTPAATSIVTTTVDCRGSCGDPLGA